MIYEMLGYTTIPNFIVMNSPFILKRLDRIFCILNYNIINIGDFQ